MTQQIFYLSTTGQKNKITKEMVQKQNNFKSHVSLDCIFDMSNAPRIHKLGQLHILGDKFTVRKYRKHIKNCVNKTIEKIYISIKDLLNYGFKHFNLFDDIVTVTSEIRRTKYLFFNEILLSEKNRWEIDKICEDIISKMNFINDENIVTELHNIILLLLYLNNKHGIIRYVINGEYCGSSIDLYNYTFQLKRTTKLTIEAVYMVVIPTDTTSALKNT